MNFKPWYFLYTYKGGHRTYLETNTFNEGYDFARNKMDIVKAEAFTVSPLKGRLKPFRVIERDAKFPDIFI